MDDEMGHSPAHNLTIATRPMIDIILSTFPDILELATCPNSATPPERSKSHFARLWTTYSKTETHKIQKDLASGEQTRQVVETLDQHSGILDEMKATRSAIAEERTARGRVIDLRARVEHLEPELSAASSALTVREMELTLERGKMVTVERDLAALKTKSNELTLELDTTSASLVKERSKVVGLDGDLTSLGETMRVDLDDTNANLTSERGRVGDLQGSVAELQQVLKRAEDDGWIQPTAAKDELSTAKEHVAMEQLGGQLDATLNEMPVHKCSAEVVVIGQKLPRNW
ncbi:hypothetical protein BDY17DRAFT_326253 [Neohortaea acidophila]|uniref:Uncharacterized protein n=1 Tax=Neohortaea acidophila TaxID=245834 RepID=A0A6A6PNJ1_9PEZI|nr:uncharacterized protein BDY17DRAFT_326253 [Neohortaea acidophila]KAF2481572.1 hypothetical protein BDY17DRAFT_326253 [Neohortaea acidophila]